VKILLTGASGFVGSSFMRRFAHRKDLEIFGVGRRATEFDNYARRDLVERLDLSFKPDVVIHAAALASPWGTPAEFVRQNVEATHNVVEFCERNGYPKLLYISSSSVFYRNEHQFDLTESSPIGPSFVNEYAASKYGGELVVNRYAGPSAILRPRAVFGPGDTVLFPRILRAAKLGRLPLFVTDGPPAVGDLLYIDNLCDYMLSAATRREVVGSYNLTNGHAVAIQDFLLEVLQRLQLNAPTRRVNVRTAMLVAGLIEAGYRLLRLRREPPLTRFGVSVFAYSKTFDVAKTLGSLGKPAVGIREGMDRFIAWQLSQS
jgi:nucleoside-diphosphate-sugar epimerase